MDQNWKTEWTSFLPICPGQQTAGSRHSTQSALTQGRDPYSAVVGWLGPHTADMSYCCSGHTPPVGWCCLNSFTLVKSGCCCWIWICSPWFCSEGVIAQSVLHIMATFRGCLLIGDMIDDVWSKMNHFTQNTMMDYSIKALFCPTVSNNTCWTHLLSHKPTSWGTHYVYMQQEKIGLLP